MYAKGECNKQKRDVTIRGIFKYSIQNNDERKTEDWGHCWSVCQLLQRCRWRQRLTGCWLGAEAQTATSFTLRIKSSCNDDEFRIALIKLVLQIHHTFLIYTFQRCWKTGKQYCWGLTGHCCDGRNTSTLIFITSLHLFGMVLTFKENLPDFGYELYTGFALLQYMAGA